MSSKNRKTVRGVKTEQDKNGNSIRVLETALFDERTCKQCRKNSRQPGSSRCKGCSDDHRAMENDNDRLQRKIEKQRSENINQENPKNASTTTSEGDHPESNAPKREAGVNNAGSDSI